VRVLGLLLGLLLGLTACATVPAPSSTHGPEAWAQLKRDLPGTWRATVAPGKVVTETFQLISADSALVERFVTASGKETMSVYHPDVGGLRLTHYCAQGNQPSLALEGPAGPILRFRFLSATHLERGQAVMVERELRFTEGGLDQVERYRQPDGAVEETTLHFVRDLTSAR
jgi:hypothetical protein